MHSPKIKTAAKRKRTQTQKPVHQRDSESSAQEHSQSSLDGNSQAQPSNLSS